MFESTEVYPGHYQDSIALMRVGNRLWKMSGVTAVQVAMGTELNHDALNGMGFSPPAADSDDLVVAIRADDEESLEAARCAAYEQLRAAPSARANSSGMGELPHVHTVGAAAQSYNASVALITVPGQHAFTEAMDALDAGLHVMVFSDNVPLEQEIRLKDAAAERDLLVMGPDCGTSLISGAGLGFANAVSQGAVSVLAASGTGAQQVMSLLEEAGVGMRHVIGTGGRDLSAEVGGRSTLRALQALDADPETEFIVLVSKPPSPEVTETVKTRVHELSTPVYFALLGEGLDDLTTATEQVLSQLNAPIPEWPVWQPGGPPAPAVAPASIPRGKLYGLFVGGTLCSEAALIAAQSLGPTELSMTDFGEDRFTQERAHPMVDPSIRAEHLATALRDPHAGAVLLDVVLGHGSEPDPAATLSPMIDDARVPVVVSLCGTPIDPQDRDRQANALQTAGATVYLSNAAAARRAVTAAIEGQ